MDAFLTAKNSNVHYITNKIKTGEDTILEGLLYFEDIVSVAAMLLCYVVVVVVVAWQLDGGLVMIYPGNGECTAYLYT